MNAATFHLILTNQISRGQFFVADVDRGDAVWNQPIFKYSFTLNGTRAPTNSSAKGTTSEVLVHMQMIYTRESVSRWTPHTLDPVTFTKRYQYYLELDAKKNILGGNWVSWDRPDFSWRSTYNPFHGYFNNLGLIYNASVAHMPKFQYPTEESDPSVVVVDNHLQLDGEQSGRVSVQNYGPNHRQSWSIVPSNGTGKIQIVFNRLSTERNRDKIRIYEGEEGRGALLAVIHGDVLPPSMIFESNSILVKFVSDRTGGGEGFELEYNSV
eukprot:TRINITY_DN5482_c2_g1_i1.p1 TRINITY_DN5482_c2_g1~~TRINITY_DN5482_c2_g1_i1.p1  ORF type:complete len:268 (-),score=115.35 TRINITY_DN5482_c2_g1_i1:147-950(-)